MNPRPLTIAVTGLNAGDSPAPGVGVLRSIAEAEFGRPVRRVGLAYDALDAGLYAADLADHLYLLPYPSSSAEAFRDRLLELHSRTPFDVIIPTLDAELPAFVKLEGELRSHGIRMCLPTAGQLEMRSKARLAALGERAGLCVPRSATVNSVAELRGVHQRVPYPFFVKGAFYGASRARTLAEAEAGFHKVVAEWGLPVIVQSATQGEEYNLVGLGDGDGGLLGAVMMKKLVITDKGKGWAGVTVRDPAFLDLATRFVEVTRFRGPFELETIRDQSGAFQLIEVNPRFPAWVYLAARAGMNLPADAVRLALGEPVEPKTDYQVGKLFVRIAWDNVSTIADFEQLVTLGERSRDALDAVFLACGRETLLPQDREATRLPGSSHLLPTSECS